MLRRLAPALLLLAVLAAPGAAALRIPPPPDRRINDYAGALPPPTATGSSRRLIAREATSRNQVVVAIFRSLEGESLEDYSIRLAKAWRIGQKGLDNGVIFLVFLDDRKMRIEVGYGLEGEPDRRGLVPDPSRRRRPALPRGPDRRRHRGGARRDRPRDRGDVPAPARPESGQPTHGFGWREGLGLLFVGLLIIVLVQNRMQQASLRRRGWTGGSTGWGGPFIGGTGLGGGWGGGGGSSGGGGFSGGGGSFGGGGSSGSW